AATLYTEMMRKSANWSEDKDDRPPLFYRNGNGAFGRWSDLAPEQRQAIIANADASSPTTIWPEMHDKVKDDPAWRDRINSARQAFVDALRNKSAQASFSVTQAALAPEYSASPQLKSLHSEGGDAGSGIDADDWAAAAVDSMTILDEEADHYDRLRLDGAI